MPWSRIQLVASSASWVFCSPEGPLVLVLHYRRVEQLRDILPIVVAGAGLVDQRVGVDRRSPSEVVGLLGDAYLGPRDGGPVGILDDHFEVAGAMLLDAFVRVLDVSAVAPAAGDDAAPPSPWRPAAAAPTAFM